MLALGTREGVFPRKCHSYNLPEEILREWALLRLFLCFFYMGDSRFETQAAFFKSLGSGGQSNLFVQKSP